MEVPCRMTALRHSGIPCDYHYTDSYSCRGFRHKAGMTNKLFQHHYFLKGLVKRAGLHLNKVSAGGKLYAIAICSIPIDDVALAH